MALTIAVTAAEVWMAAFAVFLATRATRHYCVAVGAATVVSAYTAAWFSARTSLWPLVAVISVTAGVLIGWLYYIVTRKLRIAGANEAYLLLVSLAVFGAVSAASDTVIQGRGAMVPWLAGIDVLDQSGSRIAALWIRLAVLSAALFLWWRADLGIRLRALGEDREALALRGVNVARLEQGSALVGFAIASIEGVLLAVDGQLTPERAFTGVLWGVAIILAMQFTREHFAVLCAGALAIAAVLGITPYLVEGDWSIAISVAVVAAAAALAGRRAPVAG